MANFSELVVREHPEQALAWRGRYVWNWFSNFDETGRPVVYRGHQTRRLELAFVAAKNPDAMVPDPRNPGGPLISFVERVFAETTPGGAKRLGAPRHRGGIVDLRPDWEEVCLAAMDSFLRQRWQPGTPDAAKLAALPGPIVEWNNWGDDRWGATLSGRRGRNALGLLLDVIAAEIRTGHVAPGADEPQWRERQEELIALLNGLGRDAQPTPPAQMSLF